MPATPSNHDLPYWAALAHCLKLGPTRWALLRRAFDTMAEAWQASAGELAAAGLDDATARALDEHRTATDVGAAWERLVELGIQVVTIADERYPKLLREIFDPPAVLFYRGDIAGLALPCLAVVGTRQASSYGLRACEELTRPLAAAGLTIVSGLAYGIDAAAHQTTLAAHGKTIAVLANGLDTVYPTSHQRLADAIRQAGGGLLSEFPPGVPALKQNFVQRNRIIAGLARATLVIEGPPESGALITARYALEANREVLAVPGNIWAPQAAGVNELIKSGAHLVTSANDVLAVLGLEPAASVPATPPSESDAALLAYLSHEPTHIDDVARTTGLPVAHLLAQLMALELAGHVKEVGGKCFVRLG